MNSKKIGMLQMLICAVLWSLSGVMIKSMNMNPAVIAGGRSLFAGLTMFIYMGITRQKIVVTKKAVFSGVMLCSLSLLFVAANKLTAAANAIVLQYTAPVFILLFSFIFLHKKPKKLDVITVVLTLGGITLFFLDSLDGGKFFGNMLAIAAGACMAAMFVAVETIDTEEKMSGILIGHLICAAVGTPFAFTTENTFDFTGVSLLIILGVVQLGIPYILYALASRNCSPICCVVIGAVEPLLNPVLVAVFCGEVPGKFALVGGVFLLTVITGYSVIDYLQDKKRYSSNA